MKEKEYSIKFTINELKTIRSFMVQIIEKLNLTDPMFQKIVDKINKVINAI